MSQEVFHFKQFDVFHDRCAMKVGTDGVLLGCLAPECKGRCLDIGTGSGLIALMIAQRSEVAVIGIDLDPEAVEQARINFQRSPWSDRLTAVSGDILQYSSPHLFNLIVCNPPFYEYSQPSPSLSRIQARTMSSLHYTSLISCVVTLLEKEGNFSVILPISLVDAFVMRCWEEGLYLFCRTDICTKEGKPVKRSVLSFSFAKRDPQNRNLCLMTEDGHISEAYRLLTKEYLL